MLAMSAKMLLLLSLAGALELVFVFVLLELNGASVVSLDAIPRQRGVAERDKHCRSANMVETKCYVCRWWIATAAEWLLQHDDV
jgi:hypothetical protein